MKKIVLLACLATVVYSCTEDKEFPAVVQESAQAAPLKIITKSLMPPSLNLSQPFAEGTQLGLIVYSDQTHDVYKQRDEYKNVKAKAIRIKGKIAWEMEPKVWLDTEPATLLAYAPYRNQKPPEDVRRIPVRIARDAARTSSYIYGTHTQGHKKVTNLSPMVWLHMKYALSQLVFCLSGEKEMAGPGRVSSVRIGPTTEKSIFSTQGLLDLTTGEITPQPAADAFTRLQLKEPVQLAGGHCLLPGIKVFPTLRKTQPNEIEALFTIDGKVYPFVFPENTAWKKGYTYTYELLFNGNSLRLAKVTVTDWEP